MRKVLRYGGKVVPINPFSETILGKKSYKTVSDYPEKIDLAIVAVPKEFVYGILDQCGRKKIEQVIIVTSGFSEEGNADEEKAIVELGNKYRMRIVGPNCFGICNPYSNLDVTFAATTPSKGNVAFISQSGALWSYIADLSLGKFGFSGFVSLGNMSDLEFSDFINYFEKDSKTKSIVLYIEKLKDGRRFLQECKKSKIPIFAVKAGSTNDGSRAAVSHTGSLATDYAVYRGAFKQAGVVLCTSLEEAFERASKNKFLHYESLQKIKNYAGGKKVFIVTNAGGAGALASDYLASAGFEIIRKENVKDPLDVLGTAHAGTYKKAFETVEKNIDCDVVFVILTPQSMSEPDKTAQEIVSFSKNSKKKIVGLFLGGPSVKSASELLKQNGILCFNTLEEFRKSL